MDYNNIYSEYESIQFNSKQNSECLNNLNSFYKSVHKYGEFFYLNTRKSIENFFNEQIKIDTKTSLSKNLFEFYRNYEDFSIKMKDVLNKLSKDIIDPIEIFQSNQSTIITETLEEFRNIATYVVEAKRNLEKIRMKYYDSCKASFEQEKNVCKSFSGKIINNDEEINNAHDTLLKYRSISENFAQLYKYELYTINKLIEENNKNYAKLVEKLKMNEESRIFFIKCNLEKFSKIHEEFTISSFEFLNRLNSNLVQVKIEEDIKLFNDKYKSKENLNRLAKEDFIPYEAYKKSLEVKENIEKEVSIDTEDNSSLYKSLNNSPQTNKSTTADVKNVSDDFEILNDSYFYSEKYQENFIESFLKQLLSENEIQGDSMGKLMEILYNNSNFSKTFIECILKERKNLYIKFNNFHNLQHFANILNTISLNLDNIQNENYELNFAIIFIAERTFCYVKKNETNYGILKKVYLSALLSKNKLYATRSFWLDLMELKLNRRIEEHINRLDRNLSDNSNPPDQKIETNLFINIGSKLKNIFNNKKELRDLTNIKVGKYNLRGSENFSESKKILINKIILNEICLIIKEYIPHFCNFNFDVSEAIDMIVELSTKYKIIKEKISFFVTYLNSWVYSIKSDLPFAKLNKKCNSGCISKKSDYKIIIISSTIKYLSQPDLIKISILNKNYNLKLSKKINEFTLSQDIHLKLRVKVWSSILKTNELRNFYNYKDILEELNQKKQKNEKLSNNIDDVIELDVQRTFFQDNVEESRSSISNILKAIALVNPKINYCQGMNYIAAFLYKITSNQEDAFFLMLGLFEFTDFSLIFLEDLLRLKIFFYVFERLVSLYLPEVYMYFKSNSVIVNYFCSPWYITLFTNTIPFADKIDPPLILLKIWDDFLLNGWKAMMRASIYLLKSYENYLITLKYEDLLHFLINDLAKSGFFQNNNLQIYKHLSNTIKIKTELINNLENEYIQDIKIKELDEKLRNNMKLI